MVMLESGAESRATAEAQVVIRQAQERARRRRITTVAAVAATLLIAAFAALVADGLGRGRPPAEGRTATVPSEAYRGTIEGVIEGCYGNPGKAPIQTIDGIVTLLTGPPPATSIRGVIPQPMGAVVAIEHIRRGERFSFRAPAGNYVVSALAGDRESGLFRYPPVAVSLHPGSTARIITAPRACS